MHITMLQGIKDKLLYVTVHMPFQVLQNSSQMSYNSTRNYLLLCHQHAVRLMQMTSPFCGHYMCQQHLA